MAIGEYLYSKHSEKQLKLQELAEKQHSETFTGVCACVCTRACVLAFCFSFLFFI